MMAPADDREGSHEQLPPSRKVSARNGPCRTPPEQQKCDWLARAADERTGESHYLVRVRTTTDAIADRTGRRLRIGPGMGAEVMLLGDKRSVLTYILTPLTRLAETAFRE